MKAKIRIASMLRVVFNKNILLLLLGQALSGAVVSLPITTTLTG